MEKKFVTEEEVIAATNTISARGEKATVLAIRQELGGRGSMSTICKHLATIRKKVANTPEIKAEMPKKLQQTYDAALETVWQTATDIASADIAAIRKSSAQEAETLSTQLKELLDASDQLEVELADSRASLNNTTTENAALREETIRLQTECHQWEKRYQEATARLDIYIEHLGAALARLKGNASDQEASGTFEENR